MGNKKSLRLSLKQPHWLALFCYWGALQKGQNEGDGVPDQIRCDNLRLRPNTHVLVVI